MNDTMTRYLAALPDPAARRALRFVLQPLVDRLSSQPLTNAGLVISGAGLTVAKTGATPFYAAAAGILVTLAAGTVLPPLTGINTLAGGFNVALFFVDSGGVVTVLGGTPATTLAGIGWPQLSVGKALIGFLVISGAGAFTGGTTPLDTATTAYISLSGDFDPTVLV